MERGLIESEGGSLLKFWPREKGSLERGLIREGAH